ncbi:hypothetical protein HELRODRAFT_85763, partial [Helobdella robusta]|uniref:Heme O synthase n=1 Tax=Helobdella robusta TaxID=6412 RepID=T1G626_HELRO
PLQAVTFAGLTFTTGGLILFTCTNPLTATLGLMNVVLYTLIYTPMKRTNIANTWVGAIVGAIPPIMGWTAATGSLDIGAILMGGVLYAWQFPHFCALSWNLQSDYSRAGYRMMSVIDPDLCRRVSLRYSLALSGLTLLFPVGNVTTWTFAVDSLPLNLCLIYLAFNFYRKGDSSSSRKLFRYTLVHLPLLLVFMIISKTHFGDDDVSKDGGANDGKMVEVRVE